MYEKLQPIVVTFLKLSVPKFSENSSIITGLEWEDPLHTNRLSISEERRLNVLITKIASLVNMKKLILRPYFQDYELVCFPVIINIS